MPGMNSQPDAFGVPAVEVSVTENELVVRLEDGRTISTPLAWYPRLLHASAEERERFELIGRGTGIHWPELDEDLSVRGMLTGRPSQESAASLQKWKEGRE